MTRTLKLLARLERTQAGVPMSELTRVLGASTRTIFRDFEALEAAGFRLVKGRREREVIFFKPEWPTS